MSDFLEILGMILTLLGMCLGAALWLVIVIGGFFWGVGHSILLDRAGHPIEAILLLIAAVAYFIFVSFVTYAFSEMHD